MRRDAIGVIVVLVLAGACHSEGVDDRGRSTGTQVEWLGGRSAVEAVGSRAEELRTMEGAAGTVAEIRLQTEEEVRRCTGVLVDRTVVLTSPACALTLGFQGDLEAEVVFPQEPSIRFRAKSAPQVLFTVGVGVLVLERPVPEGIVSKLPPVFLGDVELALNNGNLDPSSATLVGIGPSCATCVDQGIRRVGPANVDVSIREGHPDLTLDLDPSVGATLFPEGDLGAPLFLWDEWSKRFVLVGIPLDTIFPTGEHHFRIFGSLGPGRANNYELLSTHWIDPEGQVIEVLPPLEPQHGWRPLLGWDRDGDLALDQTDNCPPSECMNRGLEMWECSDSSQLVDEENEEVGKRCLGLSAPVPSFCQKVPEPPEEIDGSYAKGWLSFGWRSLGWNSNVDAEEAVGVSARHDLCDPVPQLRFVGEAPVLPMETEIGDAFVGFWAQPILGGGSWEETTTEEVAFRYCSCDAETNRGKCIEEKGCDPTQVRVAGTDWVPGLTVTGGSVQQVFNESQGDESLWEPASRFTWDWLQDIRTGTIRGNDEGGGLFSTLGFFATTVLGENWQSRRDSEWGGALRSVVGFGSTRAHDPGPLEPSIPKWVERGLARVDFNLPHCDPTPPRDPAKVWNEFSYPYILADGLDPGARPFVEWSQSPVILALDDTDSLWAVREEDRFIDLTSKASRSFLDVLAHWDPLTFHGPVEPRAALVSMGIPSGTVGVAGCHGSGIYSLTHDGTLDVRDLSIPLSMTNGMRGAYSATEQVLYVAGGAGTAFHTIRRVHLHDGSIETIELSALGPEATVLGAAYDPGTATLYVLDVQGDMARLVAHALPDGKSVLLWTVPFGDVNAFTSLDVAGNGELVLTQGRTDSFTSCRMNTEGSVVGRIERQGTLARLPSMGWHFLSVPYFDGDGYLRTQLLHPASFERSEACIDL